MSRSRLGAGSCWVDGPHCVLVVVSSRCESVCALSCGCAFLSSCYYSCFSLYHGTVELVLSSAYMHIAVLLFLHVWANYPPPLLLEPPFATQQRKRKATSYTSRSKRGGKRGGVLRLREPANSDGDNRREEVLLGLPTVFAQRAGKCLPHQLPPLSPLLVCLFLLLLP